MLKFTSSPAFFINIFCNCLARWTTSLFQTSYGCLDHILVGWVGSWFLVGWSSFLWRTSLFGRALFCRALLCWTLGPCWAFPCWAFPCWTFPRTCCPCRTTTTSCGTHDLSAVFYAQSRLQMNSKVDRNFHKSAESHCVIQWLFGGLVTRGSKLPTHSI